ncbi:efflux RND transporter permease subunit [Pseudomonas sp. TCU-HL1]|uniref:efflux RND transporter permease subunit n=1 Tax=Pseudomonas sp. TCU-HL1 TaxID=1856685 RepID=UPI000856C39B|nr:MMPL family transporter [Pseudomonas sp. TCU-HL1]AOE86759.1 RND transporter [Pseudomonas sp. TCU-HL1]
MNVDSKHEKAGLMSVIRDPALFNRLSGNIFERLIFNNRLLIIALCVIATLFSIYQLRNLTVTTSFDKMLPHSHPYIKNFLENRDQLRGLGDSVRFVIENRKGDIYDAEYLQKMSQINDEIFLIPGVDKTWIKSIWAPVVRWTEVTEEGFAGGPVMPGSFDGSPESIKQLRMNIARAGVVGSLISNDYRSSMIEIPLLPTVDGKPLSYQELSSALESIRAKYESDDVGIYITGFAKISGDMIDGIHKVMLFFIVAALVAALIIYFHTRCVRSTCLVLVCSVIAVFWQQGLVITFGGVLDAFTILIPFLIFAIGVSHGCQKMNGIAQDIARGTHPWVAARYTFRRLFLPGLIALIADGVGFAVLVLVDIPIIRELALSASLGFAMLVVTNLILLPVLLSFTGISQEAARRHIIEHDATIHKLGIDRVWNSLDRFTEKRWAVAAILVAVALTALALVERTKLQVGDLHAGSPELRPDSRYNKDNAFITSKFGVSSDVFAVMIKTAPDQCGAFETLVEADRLAWELSHVPGVQGTASLADTVRTYTAGSFEGSPKWYTISDNKGVVWPQVNNALVWNSPFLNSECSLIPVLAYLSDHKAATLARIVEVASTFAEKHSVPERQLLLAAGSAGIEAATNIIVKSVQLEMLLAVYAAVALLCLVTFRSWRAVVVAILPLVLTSLLAEALMVQLSIGLKVATLPVVALGVGVGVDYALYLLSVQLEGQRMGLTLQQAYRRAIQFTGKMVALVGVTLAVGVVTWMWSPIKFQADMGILLAFMFIWNMLAALVLIPALSHFLLNDKHFNVRESGETAIQKPVVVKDSKLNRQVASIGTEAP